MSPLVFTLFFSVFTVCFALINFGVLKGLVIAFGLKLPVPYLILISVLMGVLFLGATVLARYYSGSFVRLFYIVVSHWVGFALICGFIFFLLILPGKLLPEYKKIIFLAGTGIALLASIYATVHALERRVKETVIPFKEKLTLVQVSDVHFGVVNGVDYLADLVKEINALNPDAVLFTGDLVDGTTHIDKEMLLPLKQLKSPAYFVSGNHDFIDGLETVYQAVEEAGITILDNKCVELKGVQLGGLSFAFYNPGLKESLDSIKFKKDKPVILMYHEPKGTAEIEAAGVDLMLSGHTHGGQIIPFNFLVRLPYRYMAGLYKIGNLQLFVSTGCGTWGPKMRLGTDSEINLLKLEKPKV